MPKDVLPSRSRVIETPPLPLLTPQLQRTHSGSSVTSSTGMSNREKALQELRKEMELSIHSQGQQLLSGKKNEATRKREQEEKGKNSLYSIRTAAMSPKRPQVGEPTISQLLADLERKIEELEVLREARGCVNPLPEQAVITWISEMPMRMKGAHGLLGTTLAILRPSLRLRTSPDERAGRWQLHLLSTH